MLNSICHIYIVKKQYCCCVPLCLALLLFMSALQLFIRSNRVYISVNWRNNITTTQNKPLRVSSLHLFFCSILMCTSRENVFEFGTKNPEAPSSQISLLIKKSPSSPPEMSFFSVTFSSPFICCFFFWSFFREQRLIAGAAICALWQHVPPHKWMG